MPRVCAIRLDRLDAKGLPRRGGGLLSQPGSAAILAGLPTAAVKRGLTGHSGFRRNLCSVSPGHRWPCHPLAGCPSRARRRLAFCGDRGVWSHDRDDKDQLSGWPRRWPLFRGRWFAAGSTDFSFQGRLAAVRPDSPGDCLDNLPVLHCAPSRVPHLACSGWSSIIVRLWHSHCKFDAVQNVKS